MKRLLSIALSALMILTAVVSLCVPAATAAGGKLTITADGMNAVTVDVGNEVLFTVGLYAGEDRIINGQGYVHYDSDYLSLVRYGEDADDGIASYSFPARVSSSVVCNPDNTDYIYYNFSKANGYGVFNDPTQYFLRFRFCAIAAGTTDISSVIEYMVNYDEVHIYYKGEPNEDVKPYTVSSLEAATALIGDVDGDYEVTIMDATMVQRIAAGVNVDYNLTVADVNSDLRVSLKDAVALRRYLAGASSTYIGTWTFASELG